jgi:hypothetical protein
MSIQNLLLGSLVSRGADRLLNRDKFNRNQFNILTGGGYTGEDEEKDKGPTTFGGIAKSGIMSLIAQAVLGPVFGPLALTLGRNFVDRRQAQGLGLNPFGGGESTGPAGIVAGKVQTLDGRIVDSDSDEARADLDARDQAFQETGDYDVYSDTVTTGPSQPAFDPAGDYYTGSDEEDRDNESNGDSGGGGGSSSASTAGDAADYSGPSPFRYGGLASLYR